MSLLDDLAPRPLQLWTTADLEELRDRGTSETLFFEFKREWHGDDVEKAVCAFANRLGGFLMFGVTTESKADNRISGFPGLDASDWPVEVANWVIGHISPLPLWDTVSIISPDDHSRWVVVTRVEESWRTPHVVATQNGRIYIRTPGGSHPVRDKADIDALVARGAGGDRLARHRAEQLHSLSPGAGLIQEPSGAPYIVQVAAVPSPGIPEGAFGYLLTQEGARDAGAIFTSHPLRLLDTRRLVEDGVLMAREDVGAARFTDGFLFVRTEHAGAYLSVGLVERLVEDVLQGCAAMRPTVHQVVLDVRMIGVVSRPVDPDGTGRHPGPPFGTDVWGWSVVTGTTAVARSRIAAEVGRRIWRVAGDARGHEPPEARL